MAVFDNADEFHADIQKRAAQLRARRDRGDDVDPVENISGQMYEPGYRRLQRNARLIKRAIRHGVAPAGFEDLDLPPNVAVIRAVGESAS